MGKPNIAKRNARAFERWFAEDHRSWPTELQALGQRCVNSLNMIPGQERHLKNPAFAACVQHPITEFHEAHSAFVASH